jgi:hypothetical protein
VNVPWSPQPIFIVYIPKMFKNDKKLILYLNSIMYWNAILFFQIDFIRHYVGNVHSSTCNIQNLKQMRRISQQDPNYQMEEIIDMKTT